MPAPARAARHLNRSWFATVACAVLLAIAIALPATAQIVPPSAPVPAPAAPAPANPPPSAAELQSLVDTLQDEKARAALVGQLRTLLAARRGAPEAPQPPADPVARFTEHLNTLAEQLVAGVATLLDVPRLAAWLSYQVNSKAARARWIEVLFTCLVVFGAALVAEWVARRALARIGRNEPTPRADARPMSRGARLAYATLGLLVETLPVAAFGAAAFVAMAVMLPPEARGREAIRVLVWAATCYRLATAAATALLVPRLAWPSLVPASEESRNYLLIWVRRLAFWLIFAIPATEAAWWLGLAGPLHALLLKSVGIVLTALAIVFILQNRLTVRQWITGEAPAAAAAGWNRLRHHLGESWHVLAIAYVIALDVAYTLHHQGGSAFVVRATALSVAAFVGARFLARFIERLSSRGLAIAPDLKARLPQLEQRANRYLPLAIRVVTLGIYALAALATLEAWDFSSFDWFRTEFGRRASGSLLTIGLVLGLAVLAWETLAATIERHLVALDHSEAPGRARRRTLLPLLRTAILCVIVAIAGLTVLSQLGINIAPLLAGAGVIGLAVGFGSQALIKDIITGLFILIEDQIAIGDIVDLGKEHAGVVEAITIRTIRLRDQAGTVHTVPFSDVTSVKNLTREYAFFVARIGIAYGEDIDRAIEILRGVCDDLAEDPEIGPFIIDRFDYQGVDSLADAAVILLLRIRTLPAKQWTVGRAFNRRVKIAFDTHKVATRDPSPILVSGPLLAGLARDAAGEAGPEPDLARRRLG